jgi:hypothetical protein
LEFNPLSQLEEMSETLKTWIETQYDRDRDKGDLVGNEDIEFANFMCITMLDALEEFEELTEWIPEVSAGQSNTTASAPVSAEEEGEQTALLSRIRWSARYQLVVDRVTELDASMQRRCSQATLTHSIRRMDTLRGYADALAGGKEMAGPNTERIVTALPKKRQAQTTLDVITGERSFHDEFLKRSSLDLKSLMVYEADQGKIRTQYEETRKSLEAASSVAHKQVWEHRNYVKGLKKKHSDLVKTLDAAMTMLEDHVKAWLVLYVFIRVKETVAGVTDANPTWEYLQTLKTLNGGTFSDEIINTEKCVKAFVDAYLAELAAAPESPDSPYTGRGYGRFSGGVPSPVPLHFPLDRSPNVNPQSLLVADPSQNFSRAPLDFFS